MVRPPSRWPRQGRLAYVRIEEALWDQGPAIVNAEIKRRIEELEPPQHDVVQLQARISSTTSMSAGVSLSVAEPAISAVPVDNPPIAGAAAQPHPEVLAAWQSADAGLQMPYPRRQYVPDVFFNRVALADKPPAPVTPELRPPEAPLPPPSPATRFVVQQGIVDVVPPTAWAGREAQVATYHARARTIALSFSDKLANTDAEPELAASVLVVVDVLGDDPSQLQPDQLRLASRTITSKARAYGHPSARGELGVESVSTLFHAYLDA